VHVSCLEFYDDALAHVRGDARVRHGDTTVEDGLDDTVRKR
jgi:hypothetical protein